MSHRLVLIRHGRVDFDAREFRETVRGRQWDPPLAEAGREQAERLAARLAEGPPPSAVYVSPFRRCLETLAPYRERTGFTASVVEDIGEVFVGDWEGVPFEDLVAENEDFIRRRLRDHEAIFAQAPNAETGEHLRTRVVAAVEAMLEASPPGDILIITHGGVINAYVGHVMRLTQDMFFLPDNSSLNVLEADGDDRRLRFLNDVAHLWYPALWSAPDPSAGGA